MGCSNRSCEGSCAQCRHVPAAVPSKPYDPTVEWRRNLDFYRANPWRDSHGRHVAYLEGLLADFEDEQHARAEHERGK